MPDGRTDNQSLLDTATLMLVLLFNFDDGSAEMTVHRTTRRYIPEDKT
jgi:hypothetical protein